MLRPAAMPSRRVARRGRVPAPWIRPGRLGERAATPFDSARARLPPGLRRLPATRSPTHPGSFGPIDPCSTRPCFVYGSSARGGAGRWASKGGRAERGARPTTCPGTAPGRVSRGSLPGAAGGRRHALDEAPRRSARLTGIDSRPPAPTTAARAPVAPSPLHGRRRVRGPRGCGGDDPKGQRGKHLFRTSAAPGEARARSGPGGAGEKATRPGRARVGVREAPVRERPYSSYPGCPTEAPTAPAEADGRNRAAVPRLTNNA